MAGESTRIPLGELYEFSSGLSKPRSAFGSGYPFLGFKDVFYNSAVPDQLAELVNSTEQERERCSVRRGDVFVTRTSETIDELGMSCVALRDVPNATFNGFTKRLRPINPGAVVPEYARYYFRSPAFRRAVTSMSSLSTRASLNNEMLHRLWIMLPSPGEQRAIAHILGTLDDKIELNRRRNQILEAMARSLFKDWFVNFGPIRAKMEGREPYLPADLWQLFPDRLDDNGKPQGWEMQPLSELLTIIGGGTPKTSVVEHWGGEIPWFSVVDTPPASDVFVVATEKTITGKGLAGSSARMVPKGTTIISARGTVGNLAIAGCEMTFNQSCYGLRGTGSAGDYFVYLTAQQLVDELKSMAHGSVFSTITRQTFEAIRRPIPPPAVLTAFEGLATGWFDAILSSVEESSTLAQLRDALLPKLISGELRIADTERFMERVA